MPFPDVDQLDEFILPLVEMVARTSWLPNKETILALGRAVFPTMRYRVEHPRLSTFEEDGEEIGMFDDNATPEWALAWSHNLTGTRPKGWTIAHVWATSDDINAYTHPANLALVPECFASLTDKNGPLTKFLQWHAFNTYSWKPEASAFPEEPEGYNTIEWRCFEAVANPAEVIRKEFNRRDNQRTRILRPIMQRLGTL